MVSINIYKYLEVTISIYKYMCILKVMTWRSMYIFICIYKYIKNIKDKPNREVILRGHFALILASFWGS